MILNSGARRAGNGTEVLNDASLLRRCSCCCCLPSLAPPPADNIFGALGKRLAAETRAPVGRSVGRSVPGGAAEATLKNRRAAHASSRAPFSRRWCCTGGAGLLSCCTTSREPFAQPPPSRRETAGPASGPSEPPAPPRLRSIQRRGRGSVLGPAPGSRDWLSPAPALGLGRPPPLARLKRPVGDVGREPDAASSGSRRRRRRRRRRGESGAAPPASPSPSALGRSSSSLRGGLAGERGCNA